MLKSKEIPETNLNVHFENMKNDLKISLSDERVNFESKEKFRVLEIGNNLTMFLSPKQTLELLKQFTVLLMMEVLSDCKKGN